ncbi:uncharacterized protein KZ484_002723 isoform 2-T2 [Pholidichthys leucotaenia]
MRMAASSAQRRARPSKMLLPALLLIASLINEVLTQDPDVVTAPTTRPATAEAFVPPRGDMIPRKTEAPATDDPQGQILVLPSVGTMDPVATTEATTEEDANSSPAAPEEINFVTVVDVLDKSVETPPPIPPRGDNINNKPQPQPQGDVICVTKEAVEDKNTVHLKLKTSSSCKDTKMKIESVLQELCGEDCKLELYQEDSTDETIVSGKYVEEDITGMVNKFNNDNIKDKTNVEGAFPHWGKNSKLVLVSLLLAGLLLAALLVAGYYFKTHRKNSKGVRLAESFQVDEENQANTLVSVAPLPQEPIDKPTVNGESPPENGTNPNPTTNGHSATQTPVADTEM